MVMTDEEEKELLQKQKEVFDWMFKEQEERLKRRGYSCNYNRQRTLVIDLYIKK